MPAAGGRKSRDDETKFKLDDESQLFFSESTVVVFQFGQKESEESYERERNYF
jgi:hypothetical protein